MAEDITTPLGYVKGEMEIVGAPTGLTYGAQVIAISAGGQPFTVYAAPNTQYAIGLPPGNYKIHAAFGPAISTSSDIIVQNGQTVTVDFAFGKDAA